MHSLGYNKLGSAGAAAVAEALKANAVLSKLDTHSNKISGEAAQQLASAVLASKSLEVLSEVPIKELRADSLTELDLRGKDLGSTEAMVIAALIEGSAVLKSIDLSDNMLCGVDWEGYGTYDPSGIQALAAALSSGSAVLTTLMCVF